MSTKTLLAVTVTLVFLGGIGFGFGLNDVVNNKKLVPSTPREQTFFDAMETERLSITSPAENMRVAANNAARDYAYQLTSGAVSVAQGGDTQVFSTTLKSQATAVVAAFSPAMNKQNQTTMIERWTEVTDTYLAYAKARSTNNPADLTTAAESLNASTEKLLMFLANLVPATNGVVFQNGISQWTKNILAVLEPTTMGAIPARITAEQLAARNLGLLMDSMTAALVQQSPSAF